MSYIISSGNKKPQWVPEPKAKKTAQADPLPETPVIEEEANPFFDAVKDLPGIKEQATGIGLGEALENAQKAIDTAKEVAVKEGVIEPGAVSTPVSDPAPAAVTPPAPVTEGAPALDAPAPDLGTPAPEAPKAEEKPADAPAEEKKDGGNPFAEKKDEGAKPEGEKKVNEVEVEIPGVKDEGKTEKESCGIGCGASVDNSKLVALAKLSPENRKDLSKFWKEDLGMPADWVDSMLKDY